MNNGVFSASIPVEPGSYSRLDTSQIIVYSIVSNQAKAYKILLINLFIFNSNQC